MVEAFDIETFYTYEGKPTANNLNYQCKKQTVVHVCAMAYTNGDDDILVLGTDEKDQVTFFNNMPAGTYATWNGAKFDNHAIIYLLHKYGFRYDYMYQKKSSMLSLEFYNKNGKVKFKDYCKIYQGTLAKILKELSPDVLKLEGEYDYKKQRYKAEDFTETDITYVKHDVRGLKIAVNKLDEGTIELGLNPDKISTAGSLATKYMKNELKKFGLQTEDLFINHELVDYSFVAGGIVQVNPEHRFKTFERVYHYDIVSFYPYVMSLSIPYGPPLDVFECKAEEILQIVQQDRDHAYFLKTNCSGVYKAAISPIFSKDRNGINQSLTYWDDTEEVPIPDPVLRSERLSLYDGTVRVAKYAKMPYLRKIVKTIFDKKTEAKLAGNAALSWSYKIIVNSLSGKFMQKPITKEYAYIHNEGITEFEVEDIKIPWHVYLPLASYITSYAREMLCGYIHGLKSNFLYTDTDSFFYLEGGDEWLRQNAKFGEDLGQLSQKDFTIYDKAAFLGKKCYLAQIGDKKKSVIAGIRNYPYTTVEEGVKNLLEGKVTVTLQAVRCVQGVVLADVMKGKNFDDYFGEVF